MLNHYWKIIFAISCHFRPLLFLLSKKYAILHVATRNARYNFELIYSKYLSNAQQALVQNLFSDLA